MKRSDFDYTYNSDGYMIIYKGQNIGGAGVDLSNRTNFRHWRHKQADLKDNKQHAERTIEQLIDSCGNCGGYMAKKIKEIEKGA